MRLTRKLAEEIDGVDLSGRRVGDILDLPPEKARLLMAEEWALPDRRHGHARSETGPARRLEDRASAADAGGRRGRLRP